MKIGPVCRRFVTLRYTRRGLSSIPLCLTLAWPNLSPARFRLSTTRRYRRAWSSMEMLIADRRAIGSDTARLLACHARHCPSKSLALLLFCIVRDEAERLCSLRRRAVETTRFLLMAGQARTALAMKRYQTCTRFRLCAWRYAFLS